MAEKKDFVNYPTPLEGPYVTFKRKESSNPVIRGWLLEVGASIISNVGILQKYLYWNNGFSSLRAISDLDYYEPRYDPTVIPIVKHESNASAQQQELPDPARRASDQGYYTSADYRALYLAKQTTPTAVVKALLPLISRDTTPPGEHSTAFLDVRPELILKAAAESTRRYEQGRSLGPLDGVPIAVKDEVDVAGYSRTLGSCLDFTGKETSWCAKALERAGAVVVGKTNMHEFGLGEFHRDVYA
ncbi:hypothetical protein KEM55_006929 [Ascosphaera atra]|nr:hypothetical protein KEM55_006929 [Ascosphaera atra]